MKYLALLMLLFAASAHADIYKCVKGGQAAYQQTPCQGAAQQDRVATASANDFVGCFAMDAASPWTNRDQHNLAQIQAVNGGYTLHIDGEPRDGSIMLRRATPDVLRLVSESFHMQAEDSVTMIRPPGAHDTKPVGIYKVKGRSGQEGYFVFPFTANGLAHRQSCPSVHAS
jgi:hypothetical protein